MFLGSSTTASVAHLTCDQNNRPVAHAVPIGNSPAWILLANLRPQLLREDILWDDQLPSTAALSNDDGITWWIRKQSQEFLNKTLLDLRRRWLAPAGGVDIYHADHLGALLEAEDQGDTGITFVTTCTTNDGSKR